jgi:hypothetical protein
MGEAAMEDANEAVGQSAESLVVGLTTSSMGIVVAASARRSSQGCVRPAEAGVYQMAVARHTREDGVARARRARDRSCPSVGLARFRIGVASGIIAKFGQRSGAEHRSQTGQARDNLRIGVLLESVSAAMACCP